MKKMDQHSEQQMIYTGERLTTFVQNATMMEHLHRYAFAQGFIDSREVLDIASGEGYGSNLMAEQASRVTGVDISKEAVDHSTKKYQRDNLNFLQGAADRIPLNDSSVDVVVSFETIEHHDKHDEMFSEIKRVLRKDGLLIISSPDKLHYSELPKVKNTFHVKELYTHEFKDLVSRHFKFYYLFFQKAAYGSLIVPELPIDNSNFKEYSGDYQKISYKDNLDEPLYNICIASDKEIDVSRIDISFFNKYDLMEDLLKKKEDYEHIERLLYTVESSYAYKIGRILTFPVRWFRNL